MYVMIFIVYFCIFINVFGIRVVDINYIPEETINTDYTGDSIRYCSATFPSMMNVMCICDGDEILWNGVGKDLRCNEIRFRSNDIGRCIICIGIDDGMDIILIKKLGIWNRINEDEYYKALDELYAEDILDIRTSKLLMYTNTITTEYGNSVCNYDPFNVSKIIKIKDNENIIWIRKEEEEYVKTTMVYNRKELSILIYLEIINQFMIIKCYEYNNINQWIEITSNECELKRDMIMNEIELDILSTNTNDKFKIIKHHPYGILANVYISKLNVHTTTVKYGNEELWKSQSYYTKCTMIILHINTNNIPVLAQLYIKGINFEDGNIFMERNNNQWIQITKDELYNKLE